MVLYYYLLKENILLYNNIIYNIKEKRKNKGKSNLAFPQSTK